MRLIEHSMPNGLERWDEILNGIPLEPVVS